MSDPVEWLTAKLGEIETRAQAAEKEAPSPWRSYDEQGIVEHSGPDSTSHLHYERGIQLWDSEGCREGWRRLCMDEAVAAHVAEMHPAMVLQLVAATRQVLELHRVTTNTPDGLPGCVSCGEHSEYPEGWPCATVKALAAGWGWTEASG